ncbi:MAG: response regulator transcription factor [Deferribacteres bacterium]|nr:response regulator transcription factor [candidate division KSB1 bacterium]MCB9511228.1 response regulator transcription factor [Deferribacteres bacterium]
MRVLVVEDEKDVASFVGKVLRQEKHAVDIAYDGKSGEDKALSESYDLILLDIMLPGKDGLSVLRALRDEGLRTPVLILSARGEVHDRVKGLDLGADDYLAKPFAVAELRARVRSLLRRNAEVKSPVLTLGALALDTVGHEVRVNGTLMELTNREYAILEYLLRNKNRLLSKGMIAEHVWDFHFEGDYNIIEVYIRRLRTKIEECGCPRIIHTVRNGGYVMREPE